ncbi:serine protease 30-like [Pomacea canaliculata]|uniref:serine protease 30-like n=1 Tax=Pomacea canaliculata TaxID=400727 RepID=UPI000D73C83D|nr:serine protease 30-like [Pomacea canaliculata]
MNNQAYSNFTDLTGSTATIGGEQGPGGSHEGRSVRTFIKGLSWRHLAVGCFFLALLAMVIGISVHFAKTGTTREDEGCISPSPRVRQDLLQDPDFGALLVFFWPWSPDMEDTNSPMYEETISKAEYWVTKIFQTSSLSSCIRSAAMKMTRLVGNILVILQLSVSCDSAGEIEINRAYIEGHALLQRTQDRSCVVNISKNIYLQRWRKNITITDPVPPSAIPDTICGQSQLYPVPKIVGGRPAKRGQYPWVVKLDTEKDNISYSCGGTIWDYNHILTAAHCIEMLQRNSITGLVDPQAITVTAGKWESESNLFPYEQQRSVASARIHTGYYNDNKSIANDIALLKLAEPLHPTQLVMKVCHPHASTQLPKKGIVAGWGQTKDGQTSTPEVQQSVELSLLDQSDCEKHLINYFPNNMPYDLANGSLCAIDDDLEERDSCQGDSGGPLFANLGTGGVDRYTILGIVSYGDGCGKKLKPGVYASVQYYLDWIQNTILFLG